MPERPDVTPGDAAKIVRPLDWMDQAACRGQGDLFFSDAERSSYAKARAICAGCKVRADCLDYALSYPAFTLVGIWAGTTREDRATMRRVV
jgi:WhiB family redox-sensing transcriptional regulator